MTMHSDKLVHCDVKHKSLIVARPAEAEVDTVDTGSACSSLQCSMNIAFQ